MLPTAVGAALAGRRRRVLLSSVSSDSHTWNLVFLQLLLEEMGHDVTNLGACVPDEMLVRECAALRPDLVVISTVNGHGHADGKRLIGKVRARPETRHTPVVIGGKLGINGGTQATASHELVMAGFDAVFQDDADPAALGRFLDTLELAPNTREPGQDVLEQGPDVLEPGPDVLEPAS
ncbi:cobalamin B12-binding domain-containing protein [Streptomyces scopuliridis]|uniref:Cobalamin B12-binding domain-containing protein n=1 Tax=Streptomyces scopuliridis TaxID=452529 RepID=A0ACD4ZW07_9ACTN|nr:cobalamin-dependent protein [Streptomyces scopuliridis]WSC02094.1 cobalamin B12-binding domain-containing protein [Streptomyces scopuliridis]WSC04369.1 cobalamin B12-binding domain-containing protein [Streptomyces scopuliridis]